MRKFIILASSMAFSVAAPAQQLLQCVNPDVLNSLVFNARAEAKMALSAGMPDVVAGFRAPAGFTLIGSGARGDSLSTVVGYKTSQETQAAFDTLLGFLSDEGWKPERMPEMQQPMVSVVGQQRTNVLLCRNGERRNLSVQESNGARYATITGFDTTPARACDAPLPQQVFAQDPMAAVHARQANLPRFSFPESARMGAPYADGSGISGNTMAFTSTRIESPDKAANLARHLARQLVEQGWRSDAEWTGEFSAGSTWSRRSAAGQALWGTLEVLGLGANAYEVGFNMAMRP